MDRKMVWVDPARCTGCGACADVCPVGAIDLVGGKAHVVAAACIGCGACVDVCEAGAMQFVGRDELVPAPEQPAPAARQPSPLVQTVGAAVAVAGTELLTEVVRALGMVIGRWLTGLSTQATSPAVNARLTGETSGAAAQGRRAVRGQRSRRRRRGGW